MQITPDVGLRNTRFGVERSHNQQLQAELTEQLQRVFSVLVIHLGEHLIHDDELEAIARWVFGVEIVLVGDGGHEDRKGQFRLFAAGLTAAVLIDRDGL